MSAPSDQSAFLLRHFDRLAETPGGIAKLRALILQLAVEGKFAANPNTVASAEGDWRKCTLADCARVFNGRAYKQQELLTSGTPVIRIQNLNGGNSWYYSDLQLEPQKYCDNGDLVYAWSGTFGPYIWGGPKAIFHYHIWKLELSDIAEKKFIFFLLQHLTIEIKEEAHGLMLPHMTKERFEKWPVLLPPLAEQRRIVAKVEELMGLCDALEAAQQEREAVRTRLRTSALHQLASPDSDSKSAASRRAVASGEGGSSVSFVLQNLTNLINAPEDLPLLRQSIFQLAISGGLLARVDPWKTAHLDSVAECRLGKMLDAHKNTGRSTKYLRNTNVHWFRFELDSIKELKLEVEEFAEYEVHPGDVMICEGGHGIGRTAVWRGEIQGIIFQKALHRVRPKKDLHPDFFSYVMKVFYDTGVLSEFYTGAGIPHLTGQELKKITIPLPPLAEQRRIVAKVDELMAVLDALEATLTSARTTSEKLLAATIAKLAVSPSNPLHAA